LKKIILTALSLVFLVSCGAKDSSKEVLATIDGKKITLGDLQTKYPDLEKQLFKLEENAFRYKEMYLGDMLENTLIELEAKKRDIPVEELVNQEIRSKISPVSDKEVEAFGKDKNIPKDQMSKLKDRVKQYLSAQREAELRKNFANELKKQYNVKMKIKKPGQTKKVKVEVSKSDPWKGNDKAKVTVVEFTEFQCPFCKRASNNLSNLAKDFGDKVKVVFKHFPLSFHDRAHISAQASMCMHDQDKFWEYHDVLFDNNNALQDADLKKYAKQLGADMKQFEECITSGKHKAKVDKDFADAQKYGVSGAPTYFINGTAIVGAVPYAEIKQAVEEALNN
jgi:protein-disulfide isomerase